ncbi:MAG: hypothetical protein IJS90_05285 [Clostridia bacterium]|nr:hypothetical protein [Clostridia bacterium]
MNKQIKTAVSVVITLSLLLLTVIPSFAALGEGYYSELPTVYLEGQGTALFKDKKTA